MWAGTWFGTWAGGWLGALTAFIPPDAEEFDTPVERTFGVPVVVTQYAVPTVQTRYEAHEGENMIKLAYKDPSELQDYELDWTARLDALPTTDDVIDTSVWTIETDMTGQATPLVIEAQQLDAGDDETRVWVSGGVLGQKYVLRNDVVTDAGRELTQRCQLPIKER